MCLLLVQTSTIKQSGSFCLTKDKISNILRHNVQVRCRNAMRNKRTKSSSAFAKYVKPV